MNTDLIHIDSNTPIKTIFSNLNLLLKLNSEKPLLEIEDRRSIYGTKEEVRYTNFEDFINSTYRVFINLSDFKKIFNFYFTQASLKYNLHLFHLERDTFRLSVSLKEENEQIEHIIKNLFKQLCSVKISYKKMKLSYIQNRSFRSKTPIFEDKLERYISLFTLNEEYISIEDLTIDNYINNLVQNVIDIDNKEKLDREQRESESFIQLLNSYGLTIDDYLKIKRAESL